VRPSLQRADRGLFLARSPRYFSRSASFRALRDAARLGTCRSAQNRRQEWCLEPSPTNYPLVARPTSATRSANVPPYRRQLQPRTNSRPLSVQKGTGCLRAKHSRAHREKVRLLHTQSFRLKDSRSLHPEAARLNGKMSRCKGRGSGAGSRPPSLLTKESFNPNNRFCRPCISGDSRRQLQRQDLLPKVPNREQEFPASLAGSKYGTRAAFERTTRIRLRPKM